MSLSGLAVAATLPAIAGTLAAQESKVHAKVETVSVADNPPLAKVTLRVSVKNGEPKAISNVTVIFPDGLQTGLGNIAPGATGVGPSETHNFDYAQMPTHRMPVTVTVRFTLNGATLDKHQMVTVSR